MLNEKVVTPPSSRAGLTPSFVWGFSLWGSLEWSGIVSPWEWLPGGLRVCSMWCLMLNSSPGPQIVFHCKIKCMVPLNAWQFEEFFRVLLLHSCVLHLDASERPRNLESAGVRDHL